MKMREPGFSRVCGVVCLCVSSTCVCVCVCVWCCPPAAPVVCGVARRQPLRPPRVTAFSLRCELDRCGVGWSPLRAQSHSHSNRAGPRSNEAHRGCTQQAGKANKRATPPVPRFPKPRFSDRQLAALSLSLSLSSLSLPSVLSCDSRLLVL